MAFVKVRVPRTSQPQDAGVGIDWGHPLAIGLKVATTPSVNQSGNVLTARGMTNVLYGNTSTLIGDSMRKGTILSSLYRSPSAPNVHNVGYFSIRNIGAVFSSNYEFLGVTSDGTAGNKRQAFLHNNGTSTSSGSLPTSGVFTTEHLLFDASISGAWAQLYRNGVLNYTFSPLGTFPWNTGLSRTLSAGASSLGIYALYLYAWDRQLSAAEIKSISENPWQIFEPEEQWIWVPDSAGAGTSVVTSDTTAAYAIRAPITSDTAATYQIRTSATADTSAAYAIRAPITSDTSASYTILTAGAVTSDCTASYGIRAAVQSDASVDYELRGAVQASMGAGYDIRSAVLSDASAAYLVRGAVASDLGASYAVDGVVGAAAISGAMPKGRTQTNTRRPVSANTVRVRQL